MKIIVIMPVKNEAWILRNVLENFSSFADHVIVADQKSIDNTKEICSSFEKVKLITNPYNGYTNEVRFMLLDEARKIPGENNLIIQLDADEFITSEFIEEVKIFISKNKNLPVAFSSPWLQLYNSNKEYRIDGVWKDNFKEFAFIDDRKLDYNRHYVTDEHINRIPDIKNKHKLKTPILHVQYLARKRCEIKQALYMCNERYKGIDPRKTNNRYSITKFLGNTKTNKLEETWYKNIPLPDDVAYSTYDKTKLDDIQNLFKEKGVEYYEPLDIWHIEELKNQFKKETNREPINIKKFPKILVTLNNIKNKIKYKIKI